MNMRGLKYIVRRGDGFQLRLPIPKDLQDKLQRKELRWSLRTDSRSVAAQKAFRATLVFVELCDSLRRMEHLTDAKIKDIIRAFYSTICAAYVPDASKGVQARERNEHHSRLAAEEALEDLASQLVAGTYSKVLEAQARRLATGFGLSFDELPELRRQQILEGIVRAYIEQGRFIEHRRLSLLDAYSPEDTLFEGVPLEAAASQDVLQSIAKAPPSIAAPKPEPTGPAGELSVGALAKKFLAAGRKVGVTAKGPWKPKTAAEYDRVMGWLVESVGSEKHVAVVGNNDLREFRDGVRQIRRKPSDAKTFKALQTMNAADQLAPKTARKYFDFGRSFFKWLQSEGYIDTVPGGSISINVPDKPQSAKRRSFTTEEINLLVGSPLFAGFKSPQRRFVPGDNHLRDDFYWVPLLLLYSGMRLGEAVLVGHKFVDANGPHPHLKLTTADQELKTLNAERTVPIHHELVDLE